MTKVTATEFKTNLSEYLSRASREEIHITENGVDVAVLSAPRPQRSWVDEIAGICHGVDLDEDQLRLERITRKHGSVSDQIGIMSPDRVEPSPNRSWVDDFIGIMPPLDICEKEFEAERLARKYESID